MNELKDPKNFLACLFDFSFSEFVVPKIIKLLYVIAIVLAAIGGLVILFSGLAAGSVLSGIGAIIVAPVAFILYVISARIWLELILVAFRIAENTGRMVENKAGASSEGTAAEVVNQPARKEEEGK